MKKIALMLFMLGALVSCGTSAVVKEANATMKGDWVLSSITYPGNETAFKVTLFNDVSSECLENSSWKFVSNNNTGSYVLSGMNCGNETRFFRWSIKEVNAEAGNYDFMLKPTDEDYKSATDQGFRINLTNLDGNQMVWEQTITFEGEPFTIRMNFYKQ
ncbi:lipocalin [Salinimicrobium gaetbulicola]|uniref:Lipocalin n=1 Tax=Salinimicrobium gaetbulicola TaxID=999702 RepID=A0ABW3IDT9_9FLAO